MQETCFLHFNFQIQVHLATDFHFLFLLEHVTPQDAHKLVLEVAQWLTASLSGLARHELTTYIDYRTSVLINGKCTNKHEDRLLFSHFAPLSHACW